MMKQLDEVKAECTVLNRTVQILKSRAGNVDEFLKDLEKKRGITGYTSVEEQIQGVSELKEQLDNNKSASLQELTALVQQIESDVKEKKTKLAPGIKKLRTLRQRMAEVEGVYVEQKRGYDEVVNTMETEKEQITKDMGSQFNEYKDAESKFHSNNVQADIFETFQRRIKREEGYMTNPDKKLYPEFKTF
jgi:intraflagellar transport protein 81